MVACRIAPFTALRNQKPARQRYEPHLGKGLRSSAESGPSTGDELCPSKQNFTPSWHAPGIALQQRNLLIANRRVRVGQPRKTALAKLAEQGEHRSSLHSSSAGLIWIQDSY
jgi:hypothetical protein